MPAGLKLAWITGAGGLIGNYLVQTAAQFAPAFRLHGLTRTNLDLTSFAAVKKAFETEKPDLIIHCAAISKSPQAQANPPLAWQINVKVTKHLAGLAEKIPFVFFSSDLVFDGRTGNYDESSPVNPLSVYAETKIAGEKIFLANPLHTVIRTSLNGGTSPTGDRGFNEEMRRAWSEGKTLKFFTDEFRCPIPAQETARATWELINLAKPGLYHLAGSERLSRWRMGELVAARCPELHPKMEAGSIKDYKGAPRPADSSLNCAKLESVLGHPLPGLAEWLDQHPNIIF